MSSTTGVVPVNLPVENDRRCAGGERFARHFQFFRRNWLKAFARENRGRVQSDPSQNHSGTAKNHNQATKRHTKLPER
jgi:hypothetical protein